MWQANFKSAQLTVALCAALLAGGMPLAHAEPDGSEIIIQRHVAPRTAFRPDSPKSPQTSAVQTSPAEQVTAQTGQIAPIGSVDDALMGNMRADQALGRVMANTQPGNGAVGAQVNATAGGPAVGASGASAGGLGVTLGIGSTVVNAMSPLLLR